MNPVMSALQWIELTVVALIIGGALCYLIAYVRDVIRFGASSSGKDCGSGGGCRSCGSENGDTPG